MRAALDTVAGVLADRPGARGWAVLGDMLELGPDAAAEHRALGAYAADRGISRIVALGEFADEVAAGALSGPAGVSGRGGATIATTPYGGCWPAWRPAT